MDVTDFFTKIKELIYYLGPTKHKIEYTDNGMYVLKIDDGFKSTRLITHSGIDSQFASLKEEIKQYVINEGLYCADSCFGTGGYLAPPLNGWIHLKNIHEFKNRIKLFKDLTNNFDSKIDIDVNIYNKYILVNLFGKDIYLYETGVISYDGIFYDGVTEQLIENLQNSLSSHIVVGLQVDSSLFNDLESVILDNLKNKGISGFVQQL